MQWTVWLGDHNLEGKEPGPLKEILSGGTNTDTGTLTSGALVETGMACLYSNQNIDKTTTILRFRITLIIMLATGLHK